MLSQTERDIKTALGSKATPRLIAKVYHNHMADSGDPALDLEDAMEATFGETWQDLYPDAIFPGEGV